MRVKDGGPIFDYVGPDGEAFSEDDGSILLLGIKDHWLLLHSLHFIIIFCTVTPCVHQSLTLILISY